MRGKALGLLVALCVWSFPGYSVVNTEDSLTKINEEGFNLAANFAANGRSGNVDSTAFTLGLELGWKNEDRVNLLILQRDYGEVEDQVNSNSGLAYFKHIEPLTENIKLSAFLQTEDDEFRAIRFRGLAGVGGRVELSDNHLFELALMYEKIESEADEPDKNSLRANFLWRFSGDINDKVRATNTIYIQPRIDSWSDIQAISQGSIDVTLTEKLSLSFYLNITHFSEPRGDADSTDYRYGSKLRYQF